MLILKNETCDAGKGGMQVGCIFEHAGYEYCAFPELGAGDKCICLSAGYLFSSVNEDGSRPMPQVSDRGDPRISPLEQESIREGKSRGTFTGVPGNKDVPGHGSSN